MSELTLSDGTTVEMRLGQGGVWEIQEELLKLRGTLVEDAGIAPEDLANPEMINKLTSKQSLRTIRATQQLTQVYALSAVKKWSREEPFDKAALRDLEPPDFNLIANKAMELYQVVTGGLPLDSSTESSPNSLTS
jgi:hypothetical protein